MTVSLNISNDEELRSYIKEQIRGQVRSLAREEVLEILREEIRKKTPNIDPNQVAIEEVRKKVSDYLNPSKYYFNQPTEITKLAREILEAKINEMLKSGITLK